MALSGSPFDTLSHKDPSLESVGASLREQFVSTRRLCLLSDGFIAQLALIRPWAVGCCTLAAFNLAGQKLRLGGESLGADPTYLLYLPFRSYGGI